MLQAQSEREISCNGVAEVQGAEEQRRLLLGAIGPSQFPTLELLIQ